MTEKPADSKTPRKIGARQFFAARSRREIDSRAEKEARKLAAANLKAAARTYSGEALETLVEIMRSKSSPPQTRIAAANSILERGHGKSVNQTEISVGIYDKWSTDDLVKFISGQAVIEGEVLQPRDDSPPALDYGGDAGDE